MYRGNVGGTDIDGLALVPVCWNQCTEVQTFQFELNSGIGIEMFMYASAFSTLLFLVYQAFYLAFKKWKCVLRGK